MTEYQSEQVDRDGKQRIAFRSTRGDGMFAKSRWTELAVYYDPNALGGACFTAETAGRSAVEGEKTRWNRLTATSLDRALQHFDDGRGMSTPARIVAEQAHAWMERMEHDQPAGRSYTDTQREAAIDAFQTLLTGCVIDNDRSDAGQAVDAVATALGMTRETAHG